MSRTSYAYPVMVDERYVMDPSPIPKFDNPKLDMSPALMGLEQAKHYALELRDQALNALQTFDTAADPLRALARYIVDRRH